MWEASQARIATAARLISEQEVQALSIDAATSNVEVRSVLPWGTLFPRF